MNQTPQRSNCVVFEIQKSCSVETHGIYAIYMFLNLRDEYESHKKNVNPIFTNLNIKETIKNPLFTSLKIAYFFQRRLAHIFTLSELIVLEIRYISSTKLFPNVQKIDHLKNL